MERTLIDVGGARLELWCGDGPGLTICAAHPADPFTEATVSLLQAASGARVVCANPRGLGGSSPGGGQTLEQMVDDLEAARRRLGEGPWVFWGMSGGGWLGELYAAMYPDAIAGLIVESACACFRMRLADPSCLISPYHPAWEAALAARGLIDRAAHDIAEAGDTEWIDVRDVGAVFRRRSGPALLVAPMPISARMRETTPALWAVDARPRLAEIAAPTLVLCGTNDPVVPIAHARAVHAGIRGSRFVAIEGGGHVPTASGHAEAGRVVRELLTSCH